MSLSPLAGLLDALISPLVGLRATEYTIVACGALLIYEHFLTFDREIFFVWQSRWSLGKLLFFLNRYSAYIDTCLAIYILTSVKDPKTCPALAKATAWLFVTGMFVSEIILAMRTYAIWSGRRSMLIFLVIFTLAVFASACLLTQRFLNSLNFIEVPPFLKPLGITCAPMSTHGQTYLEFMVFMVNQAVIAVLTLYRGVHQYRITRHPMVKTMYEDGLLYYIYVLLLSIANVVVAVAAPPQYVVLLELPLRVASSVCCTRVLLNIRGAYFNPSVESNGVIVHGTPAFKWGTRSSGTETTSRTAASLDPDPEKGENPSKGWRWEEGKQRSNARLSLGRMSPFVCEAPEAVGNS